MHSIDNLNAFSKLNIELPLTTSKVPATLDVIKARKEHYLAERAKVCPLAAMLAVISGPYGRLWACLAAFLSQTVDVSHAGHCQLIAMSPASLLPKARLCILGHLDTGS